LRQLPALATKAGQENTAGYMGHTFTGLESDKADEVEDDKGDEDETDDAFDLDALVDYLVEERLKQRLPAQNGTGKRVS
jgi:hypothetical protein